MDFRSKLKRSELGKLAECYRIVRKYERFLRGARR